MDVEKKSRRTSAGTCELCGATVTKRSMAKHLQTCIPQHEAKEAEGAKKPADEVKFFHILVEGYTPYWLHIEARADTTLKKLDAFLRDTWLECCGHLSAFHIGGRSYMYMYTTTGLGGRSMNAKLDTVLTQGTVMSHEYDFGSTTELGLTVLGERTGPAPDKPVRLLARNDPPASVCQECGQPATQVCTECLWSDTEGWFCDKCADEHEHDEEMFLPVVNSPRVGVCGYSG